MNRYRLICILWVCSFICITSVYCSTDKYWEAVQAALQAGLPKTAIDNLNKILIITQKENKYDEWLRALSQKVVMEATIQGNKPEEKVKRLKAEFDNADPNTRPLLQTILAQWYWHYYSRNSWRFMNRTATEKMSEADFTTWDLQKIFREIDSLYQNVLKEKELLVNIQTQRFIGFLEPGTMPAELRPTLYDFIAHEALTFYTSAEQAAAQPEDAFEIDANSNAFSEAEQFLQFKPVTADTGSSKYKALNLYQSLMAYHKEQKNTEAFLDLDILRLNYFKNTAFGEERNKIFIQRMTELIEDNSRYNASSLGAYYLARALAEEGDLVKAYEIATKGYKNHSESIGGKCCKNYMIELTQKSLQLTGERCIPPEASNIQISYKNFRKIYFRIYTSKWDDFLEKKDTYPNHMDGKEMEEFLINSPLIKWDVDLPATDDLKLNTMALDLPKLKPGYYRIFASWQPDFQKSTLVQHTWFWVCSYTLVSRTGNSLIDGFVLDAVSGEPIAGAEVMQIVHNDYRRFEFGEKTETDSDGYFYFEGQGYKRFLLYIKKGDEELLKSDEVYVYRESSIGSTESVIFFTDRSLYRPGQTIFFKGICTHIDQKQGIYEVIPNRDVTVYFRDVNSQEIAKYTLRTNDFGSLSGQFTAPTDRLTGSMSIRSDHPSGYATIRVEEYKRPKFTVELEKAKQAVKLNQEIEIKGKALAYTGAPIDNANVRFTVVRNASYPHWWSWYYYGTYSQNRNQQIAHGRIKTDAEGNFRITFFAKPDLKMLPENDPTFTYSIHADVTSLDGETRSGDESIRIGYSALMVNLSSGDDLSNNKKFSLSIATKTLDGNYLPAKAQIRIYKLHEPKKPIRARLLSDRRRDNEIEGAEGNFGENWMMWPKDEMAYEVSVNTEISNPGTLSIKLPSGLYKVECVAKDKYDKEVKAFLPLMVLPDWDSKKFNIKLPSIVKTKSSSVDVGEYLQVLWGTGYESGRCFVEIEHDGTILKRYWTNQNHTQHSFDFPVTEKLRGGFSVHFTAVRENRAYLNTIPISVPWSNKNLDVTIETFRDKLAPGEKEIMTLKIKGNKKAIDAAEIVAAMYDFSLDQFYPHNWPRFDFFKRAYSRRQANFINNAQSYDGTWHWKWNESFSYPTINYIHFPNYIIDNFFYYRFPPISKVVDGKDYVIYSKGDHTIIKGKVIDASTGENLIGASVIIEGTSLGAATDIEGMFRIIGVPEGIHRVQVTCIGYQRMTFINVKSEKGTTATLNIKLMTASIEGEEVIVSAMKSQSAESIARLPGEKSFSKVAVDGMRVSDASENQHIQSEETLGSDVINLKEVVIRKNLNETVFFYPHLLMEKDGTVKIEFTMPEALTKWKFMGFAHGKKCESGIVTGYTITKKELMVQPNAPRFLREGDSIYFTAKVVNVSDQQQKGLVQLDFKDFTTEQPINKLLEIANSVQTFDLKANSSEAFSWKIYVPKGTGPVSYTVAAKSENFSDGEAGTIPVLSSRIFLTESLPLHIRGPKTKNFTFDRLKKVGKSKTLDPFRFTVQMASNPTWYAIQALPFLMEFPYECSEQVFNRYYANSLAAHIANSNPRIKEIFQSWRGKDALKSNLEKNQELKSVMLMETPWVLQAQDETRAKQNIAFLFEENTLNRNLNSALSILKNNQLSNGGWSWFPGGNANDYITLYITTGFGRLKHLDVKTDISLAMKAVDYLDRWIKDIYVNIQNKNMNNLSSTIALYLYCRSFYLEEKPIPQFAKEAVEYSIKQGEKHWLKLDSRLSQGYLALALHRFGHSNVPKKILASIKERSVQNEEMGMFWREDELSWWWYRATIETQALMIEAFSEVTGDTAAMEDCKVWLLKQKQTQNWKTTKATADAVYALILRGTDYLSSTKLVEVKLGEKTVNPENVESGTGFYEKIYYKNEIKQQFSNISVKKEDKGIAWGSAHLQYFEDMSEVTAHVTNLKLDKKLFIKSDTKKGKVIEPITGSLNVGDMITVRIVLRVDRAMEYVHLKDMRGSGLEPVDVLSQYRYQDGLRYYQSTKDAATHFFIDYLPKGTYVFEYDLSVQLKGRYQNGVAEIQCMYAPEFNSHSESQLLEVK